MRFSKSLAPAALLLMGSLVLCLVGCGQRGPLYLPSEPETPNQPSTQVMLNSASNKSSSESISKAAPVWSTQQREGA